MTGDILKEAAIILIAAISLSLITNGLRPDGLDIFSAGESTPHTVEVSGSVSTISLETAVDKYRNGSVLFVDARPPEDYAKGHIRGAVNLPGQLFDEWIDDFLARTDPSIEIIAYCDGADCHLGFNVAEKLYQLGFKRVSCLTNGWERWLENSLPVVTGDEQDYEE